MKKIFYTFLLVCPLLFISSCEEEEEAQSGYNCVSNTCSAVFENPQYLTLADCQSACEEEEPPAGYLCVSNNCIAVLENPLYTTLSDCQSACSNVSGCLDESACNYDVNANIDDGSCEYALEGYDCEGNINVQLGDEVFGGIIFYLGATNEHGLIAASEDLGEFQWGCMYQKPPGITGGIGSGYQNTLAIVDYGCVTTGGGITAAQASLDADINGYSDWYLPSRDELVEMYNTIGNSVGGNVGGFSQNIYWSSNMCTSTTGVDDIGGSKSAWHIDFTDGSIDYSNKSSSFKVRPIRSF